MDFYFFFKLINTGYVSASVWTMIHGEAWFSPVDRWIVMFEPFKAKEYVSFAHIWNGKSDVFFVILH